MWTGVEFRTTGDLMEGLTLGGACRAEVIYSTSCMCTRCGTGCVEQHRRMAREQKLEDCFAWGEGLQARKGHRMCHLFSCSTSLQILTTNMWLAVPLASREDCGKQPLLRTNSHVGPELEPFQYSPTKLTSPSVSLGTGDVLSR